MPPSPVQLARDEPMARELFPLGNDDRKSQFASDSLLEGDGFELAVRGHGASGAAHRWRIWVVKADPLSPWRIRFVLTHFTLRIKNVVSIHIYGGAMSHSWRPILGAEPRFRLPRMRREGEDGDYDQVVPVDQRCMFTWTSRAPSVFPRFKHPRCLSWGRWPYPIAYSVRYGSGIGAPDPAYRRTEVR
jgi:hypothetical protein